MLNKKNFYNSSFFLHWKIKYIMKIKYYLLFILIIVMLIGSFWGVTIIVEHEKSEILTYNRKQG